MITVVRGSEILYSIFPRASAAGVSSSTTEARSLISCCDVSVWSPEGHLVWWVSHNQVFWVSGKVMERGSQHHAPSGLVVESGTSSIASSGYNG